ncbi:hypothetical protein RCL_jg3957.t1 [Rhizophagus clarus]|uniref:Uncharacterized protein n=1 Tax=Rhizophagus clarus TaxID=94130 RepID=A0A8H3QC33_9GLOM|nr:hypothetical protein RCL_jg3957.t1 [Rhizophagus clarus]
MMFFNILINSFFLDFLLDLLDFFLGLCSCSFQVSWVSSCWFLLSFCSLPMVKEHQLSQIKEDCSKRSVVKGAIKNW